jgi:hypothetical protein
MTITIGTDFQGRLTGFQKEIGDLQNQVNELTSLLDTLSTEFRRHSHIYLTGRGIGQNNTPANTGPPKF